MTYDLPRSVFVTLAQQAAPAPASSLGGPKARGVPGGLGSTAGALQRVVLFGKWKGHCLFITANTHLGCCFDGS